VSSFSAEFMMNYLELCLFIRIFSWLILARQHFLTYFTVVINISGRFGYPSATFCHHDYFLSSCHHEFSWETAHLMLIWSLLINCVTNIKHLWFNYISFALLYSLLQNRLLTCTFLKLCLTQVLFNKCRMAVNITNKCGLRNK
jgi:hypothetical protein